MSRKKMTHAEWDAARILSGVSIGELNDPHNEYGNLNFNVQDAPLESLEEIEFTREEQEALELHAERWELERGGYL